MRQRIHYWKCDRPAALHGVGRPAADAASEPPGLWQLLGGRFGASFQLNPAGGQGNHRTFHFQLNGRRYFVRLEDGPEGDENLRVESRILEELARAGVPVPRVWLTDVSRTQVAGAVQVIDFLDWADLGNLHRLGTLDLPCIVRQIGRMVAAWQSVSVSGFGPFNPAHLERTGTLRGWHEHYADYFYLNLENHLARLVAAEFLNPTEAGEIRAVLDSRRDLLLLAEGVLVHKDLALWNLLGTEREVCAVIDWDDAIAGDATDDFSLMGCFHSAAIVGEALAGYRETRPLPESFAPRFWLHLIRNLIVKSVIRCESGYFQRETGSVFLMQSGQDGPALREFTRGRLRRAVRALVEDRPLEDLDENDWH